MTIFLVRHGETEWNRARRYQGWSDSPLTERGIAQAEAIGRRLLTLPEASGAEIVASLQLAYKMSGKILYKQKVYELFDKYGYLTNILNSPTNASLARSQGTCTILDDDFKVIAVELSGVDVRLSFNTQTNQTYRLERTDNLVLRVSNQIAAGLIK